MNITKAACPQKYFAGKTISEFQNSTTGHERKGRNTTDLGLLKLLPTKNSTMFQSNSSIPMACGCNWRLPIRPSLQACSRSIDVCAALLPYFLFLSGPVRYAQELQRAQRPGAQ